ncbi:VP2 [CHeRI orbivirus 3-3]|nr:VP2 [CHeRI orbivirus 3-2]QCQ85387.1 VP2 [CHeRI orbivirus 3-3]
MAEYGVLLWRDGNPNDKMNPPDEYDLCIDLDGRIEPTAKTNNALMKFSGTEKIFKDVGTVDTLSYQTKYTSYKSTGIVKRSTSEWVMPTFIDRCIARLSDTVAQESLDVAIERARCDPRRIAIGYEYAGSGFYSLRVSHSKVLMKRNALQTVYVDRIPMCAERTHIEGINRLYSQMLAMQLLTVKMGKIRKSRSFVNLTAEASSTEVTTFLLELPKHKLNTQPVTPVSEQAANTYTSIIEVEEANAVKRGVHKLEDSEGSDYSTLGDNLEEEIADLLDDSKIINPIVPYGKTSKFIRELKLVAWKSNNIQAVKATVGKVQDWSDLKRLPMITRGIFTALYHPLGDIFETVTSPSDFYMVGQPTAVEPTFWTRWYNEIRYRSEDLIDSRLRKVMRGIKPGCNMERCILLNYYEICGFLYNLIGRWSDFNVRRKLYPVIFRSSVSGALKLTPEQRNELIKNEKKACDIYLHENYVWDNWDKDLLNEILRVNSIPCAFIIMMRYAYNLEPIKYDPDEVDSDMNLVILGVRSLESFLEQYLPMLSGLVKQANTISSKTTICELLTLLGKYNILILSLALFSECEVFQQNTAGILMFRRYMEDKYYVTHVFPEKTKNHQIKGIKIQDILLFFIGMFSHKELDHDYWDKFDAIEQEEWTKLWDDEVKRLKEEIDREKLKQGEKAETWAVSEKHKVDALRAEARYRWELINLVKGLYNDSIFDKRTRTVRLKSHASIHFSRINYTEINMLMASQCYGFSDVITVCYPISAPHKSLLLITIYSEAITYEDLMFSIARRFPKNFVNIYQHVLIEVSPTEVKYHSTHVDMTTQSRIKYKGLGPMQVRMFAYAALTADSKALIIKSDKAKRGSPFFFTKISGAK